MANNRIEWCMLPAVCFMQWILNTFHMSCVTYTMKYQANECIVMIHHKSQIKGRWILWWGFTLLYAWLWKVFQFYISICCKVKPETMQSLPTIGSVWKMPYIASISKGLSHVMSHTLLEYSIEKNHIFAWEKIKN